jgi:hypothetical protein
MPFGTGESVAGLFDCRSLDTSAIIIINGHSLSVCIDLVAVDDSILPAMVAATLRTLFPLSNKPFRIAIHRLTRRLKDGLGRVVIVTNLITHSLLTGCIGTEDGPSLNALSARHRTLGPLAWFVDELDVLFERCGELKMIKVYLF